MARRSGRIRISGSCSDAEECCRLREESLRVAKARVIGSVMIYDDLIEMQAFLGVQFPPMTNNNSVTSPQSSQWTEDFRYHQGAVCTGTPWDI